MSADIKVCGHLHGKEYCGANYLERTMQKFMVHNFSRFDFPVTGKRKQFETPGALFSCYLGRCEESRSRDALIFQGSWESIKMLCAVDKAILQEIFMFQKNKSSHCMLQVNYLARLFKFLNRLSCQSFSFSFCLIPIRCRIVVKFDFQPRIWLPDI